MADVQVPQLDFLDLGQAMGKGQDYATKQEELESTRGLKNALSGVTTLDQLYAKAPELMKYNPQAGVQLLQSQEAGQQYKQEQAKNQLTGMWQKYSSLTPEQRKQAWPQMTQELSKVAPDHGLPPEWSPEAENTVNLFASKYLAPNNAQAQLNQSDIHFNKQEGRLERQHSETVAHQQAMLEEAKRNNTQLYEDEKGEIWPLPIGQKPPPNFRPWAPNQKKRTPYIDEEKAVRGAGGTKTYEFTAIGENGKRMGWSPGMAGWVEIE